MIAYGAKCSTVSDFGIIWTTCSNEWGVGMSIIEKVNLKKYNKSAYYDLTLSLWGEVVQKSCDDDGIEEV